MRLGFAGPITLSMLTGVIPGIDKFRGYPFAGSAPLVKGYLERGHDVDIVTSSPDIAHPVRRETDGCRIILVPSRPRARDRALDQFRFERNGVRDALQQLLPNVVHAHWTYEFGLGSLQSGLNSLVTVHDWAPAVALSNRHVYWYLRGAMQIRCIRGARYLTAPSEYIAQKVRRYYRKDCVVVPNAIDLGLFARGSNRLIEQDNGGSRVRVGMLNVGFTRLKNVETALRAWQEVLRQVPGAELVLAGPGYETDGTAHEWARRHGLDKNVKFLGSLEPSRVPLLMKSLDLFLHTSLEESFGMVLVEAMAAGVPVVAGEQSGAVGEVLGGAGRLIDVRSADAIAGEVSAILRCSDDRRRLRNLGLVRADRFAIGSAVDGYLSMLQRAIS